MRVFILSLLFAGLVTVSFGQAAKFSLSSEPLATEKNAFKVTFSEVNPSVKATLDEMKKQPGVFTSISMDEKNKTAVIKMATHNLSQTDLERILNSQIAYFAVKESAPATSK